MTSPLIQLEQYTLKHPQEVLLVSVRWGEQATPLGHDGEAMTTGEIMADPGDVTDELIIFKGFSSSLQRSTQPDPDLPLVPDRAEICQIDRLQAPYNPDQPRYIEQNCSLNQFGIDTNLSP